MKKLFALVGVSLLALAARAALPQPDLLLAMHFAGAQKIAASPQASAFTNEFCSAEALALRAQTADKLSLWLATWLPANANAAGPGGAARLRPLLDDLQRSEFYLECREGPTGKVEAGIAIQLDAARSPVWQASLKPFFPAATFRTVNGWLIFDSNPALLNLGERLAQKVSAPQATPPAGWFDLDVNWPRLAQWYPSFRALGLPETQFTVTAPDDNFRVNGKFYFPENLAMNLEPWRVPTNTIHQPFNSFTAVRGFASWFRSQAWAQPYQITPLPNQLFLWSLPSFPFQTFAAAPAPDAANAVTQIYHRVSAQCAAANLRDYFLSPVTPTLTNNDITFEGIPFVSLQVRALNTPAGQFLFGELFPNPPRSKPLPPELFQRLATKNLVYYHWEITADRMPQLLHVTQLGLMVTAHKQLDANAAAFKWMQRTGASLGNTDTEVTQSGPAEFSFTRKAPGIFTATEFFMLANWLEASNFPGCDLKLPPRPARFRHLQHPPAPAAPTPGPAH